MNDSNQAPNSAGQAIHTSLRFLMICSLTLVLGACSHSMSDLEQWAAKEKAQPGGRIPPIPQMPVFKVYKPPVPKVNPFNADILQRLYEKQHQGSVRLETNRPKQYLENFPLDSLKLVGTLTKNGVTYALIQTPSGLIKPVTIGNYMGQHDGKIIAIMPTRIKLREIVPNGYGGYKYKIVSMAMSKK